MRSYTPHFIRKYGVQLLILQENAELGGIVMVLIRSLKVCDRLLYITKVH